MPRPLLFAGIRGRGPAAQPGFKVRRLHDGYPEWKAADLAVARPPPGGQRETSTSPGNSLP